VAISKQALLMIAATAALLILPTMNGFAFASASNILSNFLPAWEGFRSYPYWDYKQWSWGYGTRVPGSIDDRYMNPGGTITREQAMKDAMSHALRDYNYLKPLITIPLNKNQWAALLSFSYNLGRGNADNLIPNINAGNLDALENQWKQYINAGGVPNDDLIERRADEWSLFIS